MRSSFALHQMNSSTSGWSTSRTTIFAARRVLPPDLIVPADASAPRMRGAEQLYAQATRLQPKNPDPWYQLGLFRQTALGDQCGAYFALNAAYTLDPNGNFLRRELDEARASVNDPDNPACGK